MSSPCLESQPRRTYAGHFPSYAPAAAGRCRFLLLSLRSGGAARDFRPCRPRAWPIQLAGRLSRGRFVSLHDLVEKICRIVRGPAQPQTLRHAGAWPVYARGGDMPRLPGPPAARAPGLRGSGLRPARARSGREHGPGGDHQLALFADRSDFIGENPVNRRHGHVRGLRGRRPSGSGGVRPLRLPGADAPVVSLPPGGRISSDRRAGCPAAKNLFHAAVICRGHAHDLETGDRGLPPGSRLRRAWRIRLPVFQEQGMALCGIGSDLLRVRIRPDSHPVRRIAGQDRRHPAGTFFPDRGNGRAGPSVAGSKRLYRPGRGFVHRPRLLHDLPGHGCGGGQARSGGTQGHGLRRLRRLPGCGLRLFGPRCRGAGRRVRISCGVSAGGCGRSPGAGRHGVHAPPRRGAKDRPHTRHGRCPTCVRAVFPPGWPGIYGERDALSPATARAQPKKRPPSPATARTHLPPPKTPPVFLEKKRPQPPTRPRPAPRTGM